MLATGELALEFCTPTVPGWGATPLFEGVGAVVCATATEDKSNPRQTASSNPAVRCAAVVALFGVNLIVPKNITRLIGRFRRKEGARI